VALNALTLSITQGVQGRPFVSAINGLTTGRVEVLVDGSPGFSVSNGVLLNSGLPYPTSTVVLREYDPGVGAGFRDSRIDITAATNDALRTQAIAALGVGRSLINWRVGSVRQSDGSYVYSLFVQDDLGATASQAIGGTPTPTPGVITSVQADGASVIPSDPKLVYYPDDPLLRETFPTVDPGYDTSGNLTTVNRTIVLTMRRMNTPLKFGNVSDMGTLESTTFGGTLTGATATSDWLFSTTSADGGKTNLSSVAPPKPIASSLTPPFQAVYDNGSGSYLLPVEWAAFTHQMDLVPGQTAPCLQYRVTDSASSVGPWTNATWEDVLPSTAPGQTHSNGAQRNCASGFSTVVDLTSAAAGGGWIDWRALPAIGDSASILSTTGAGLPRSCWRIDFTKFTAAQTVMYVASTGNDTTGDGTTGNPYLTVGRAAQAIGTSRGGQVVRLKDTVAWGNQPSNTSNNTAFFTIEKDPAASGTVGMTLPANNTSLQTYRVLFRNLTITRSGGYFMNILSSGGAICFDNCVFNFAGFNSVPLAGTPTDYYFTNGSLANYGPTSLQGGGNVRIVMAYGLQSLAAVGAGLGIDGLVMVGCDFEGMRISQGGTAPILSYDNAIFAFNRFGKSGGNNDIIYISPPTGVTMLNGQVLFQNETEWCTGGGAPGPGLGLSRDPSPIFGIDNMIYCSCTLAGVSNAGRRNGPYDNNTDTTVRTHGVWYERNNVEGQTNIKGGQEAYQVGLASAANAALHIGNIPHIYGTGCRNNVTIYQDAANATANGNYLNNFSRMYAGLNATVGNNVNTATVNSSYFASWVGVTRSGGTYTAGSGGSDLRVKDTSAPHYGKVPVPLTRRTLGGNVRPTPASAGARELVA
jgi:hypothetical protein